MISLFFSTRRVAFQYETPLSTSVMQLDFFLSVVFLGFV